MLERDRTKTWLRAGRTVDWPAISILFREERHATLAHTMFWTRREFVRLASMAGVGACVPLQAQQPQGHRDIPAFDGAFLVDDASLRIAAADGGRMLNRPPIGVLKPGSIKDVQQAVRYAKDHGVKVAIRGRGIRDTDRRW
jgi:hypothetical protein